MRTCGDCGAAPNSLHEDGCGVERCARCGGQRTSCQCVYIENGLDPDMLETHHPDIYYNGPTDEMFKVLDAKYTRLPWTGEWPFLDVCRAFDLWCIWDDARGWVKVTPGTPDAKEDLNELYRTCRWDPTTRQWYKR